MKDINIAVIGGGVAGLSASIYALRGNAKVTLYEQGVIGGLTATIDKIDNYPSYTTIDGFTLTDNMYQQALSLGLNVQYQQVVSLSKVADGIEVVTPQSTAVYDAVVVATGTYHNKLGLASEEQYVGKGVSYCATCDGNFYKNKSVVVVGSGNSAVKEALYLSGIASQCIVVCSANSLSGDSMAIEKLLSSSNVQVHYNSVVSSIDGDNKVQGITIACGKDSMTIECSAVFVAVGSKPASHMLTGSGVVCNNGYVVADETMMTNIDGIFVAGDVYNGKLKQIITACGNGATAGNFAVIYARTKK